MTGLRMPNGSRLSCGAEIERSQIKDYHRGRGADSFKRLLGCAPIMLAECLPCTGVRAPRHRPFVMMGGDKAGWTDARNAPPGAAPRPDETFIAFALSWERTGPTDARADEEPSPLRFWKTVS